MTNVVKAAVAFMHNAARARISLSSTTNAYNVPGAVDRGSVSLWINDAALHGKHVAVS